MCHMSFSKFSKEDLMDVCMLPDPVEESSSLGPRDWVQDLVESKVSFWSTGCSVQGEPVFSVMAASWSCEKSGGIEKVEDVKPVL
jgi:hypothetical protein